jgi:ribulose-bisphosphate carboxylase large chain
MSVPRFTVSYLISLSRGEEARRYAEEIAVEQTVEVPRACIPSDHYRRGIVGELVRCEPVPHQQGRYEAHISYALPVAGNSIPQFLNVLFGNISLKNNIRITDIRLPDEARSLFPGPSQGIDGIRRLTGVYDRPLACTALKPMGSGVDHLAAMAEAFALGGADLIKDDHGLADQPWHPFEERVARCQEAVSRANDRTGGTTVYCPMISGRFEEITRQVEYALSHGVEGILVAPLLVGMDTVRYIARTYHPLIVAHPAFAGTHFHDRTHGMSPAVLLGTLFRHIGADISVFPNSGGRFGFTGDECRELAHALRRPHAWLAAAMPAPAGGMQLERIEAMIRQFGDDSVLLIGGALMQHSGGVSAATRAFMEAITTIRPGRREHRPSTGPTACELPAAGSRPPSPLTFMRCRNYRWEGRGVEAYARDESTDFSGITRQSLTGTFGENTAFDLRYFEIAPGGYSSLERHAHEHVIIGARGEGVLRLGELEQRIAEHDIAYVRPQQVHRLYNRSDRPFGFYCIVDHHRDRPMRLS